MVPKSRVTGWSVGALDMEQQKKKFKWITDRRVQGIALLLIAAAGLRQATIASSGSSSGTGSTAVTTYPLVMVTRDFRPGYPDFAAGVGDSLPASVGNVGTNLDANGLPTYTGAGKVLTTGARTTSGQYIMPSAAQSSPVTNFTINGASITSNQPMVAKVTFIGAGMVTTYGISGEVNIGSTHYTPFGAYSGTSAVNLNGHAQISAVLPDTIAPGTPITVDGRSWTVSNKATLMTVNSANGGIQVQALRNGSPAPTVAAFTGQVSAKAMLTSYLNAAGNTIVLKPNQVIYLFELGVTDPKSSAFDMQDLVVLVELASDASYFNSATAVAPAPITDACGNTINDTAAVFGAANTGGVSSAATFAQWFTDVPGTNVSQRAYLSMTKDSSGVYSFVTSDFTPIDKEMYGNQGVDHNRGFTATIDAQATYSKCTGQFIEYSGSGDAWIFINGKLALDLGGTHAGASQTALLDRLGLTDGSSVHVQIFYAQRTSNNATFSLRTNTVLSTPNSVGVPGVSGIRD